MAKKKIIIITIIFFIFLLVLGRIFKVSNTSMLEEEELYVIHTKNILVIIIRAIERVITLVVGSVFGILNKLFELIFGI